MKENFHKFKRSAFFGKERAFCWLDRSQLATNIRKGSKIKTMVNYVLLSLSRGHNQIFTSALNSEMK